MKVLPRSWLFVPGSRPDQFLKAASSGTDAIILDLEDAVAEADKDRSREFVLKYLAANDRPSTPLAVRINPLSRVLGLRDLAALATVRPAPDYVVIPKAEHSDHLSLVTSVLREQGSPVEIVPLIESALGIAEAARLATSSPALAALMFGAADYAADLGLDVTETNLSFARSTIVNAAAAAAIPAIDSPDFEIDDGERLFTQSRFARATGFHGKMAIHPRQISPIRDAFAPTDAELERAHAILSANIESVVRIDGKMVDAAMVRWARRIAGGGIGPETMRRTRAP